MKGKYWLPLLAALSVSTSVAVTLPRVERGSLTYDNIPPASPQLGEQLDAYLNSRRAKPLGFTPKGQLLIVTRFGDVDQLHLVEHAGGERRQLTFLHEPVSHGAVSPDPAHAGFAFLKDAGGNENSQLYYQRIGESTGKLLTDGKSMNGAPVWSNTGRELAFFSTARDGVSYDIDVVEPEAGTLPRLVVSGDGASWTPLDWSPDDRKLLVLRSVSSYESYLYIVDLSNGQKKEVEPGPGATKVNIVDARFSRDGQGVYVISDRDSEYTRLRYVNLFSNEKTIVLSQLPWDIEQLALSRDGHYLAYVSNEAGTGKLNLLDLKAHQDLTVPKLAAAGLIDSLSFDAEGKRLVFGYAAASQPGDAYVLDIAANHLEAWTHSEAGSVDAISFVTPRLAKFPTFDRLEGKQREIPLYIFEPVTPGPHPVLISLHGGPEAQFRPGFDPWIQFAVNELGFAVVAPNVRGSTGYGKAYAALDNGTLREDAVKDVGTLLVWIGLQNNFDSKRVFVSGGSYGGYLTLAALVNYSDRLRGGVDLAGFTDFVSFLTHTAPYRQNQRRAEYGDEREPETRAYLRRISPLTNADRISRPLLVVQGKNDPRVPVSEAEQIVNRLRARNSEVWYLLAADEGHGFRKKANQDAYLRTFAEFLTRTQ